MTSNTGTEAVYHTSVPPVASIVPADTDILCEGCGYTLSGLPHTGKCPECGRPIEQSLGGQRTLAPVERDPTMRGFLNTWRLVLFRTRTFYANLAARTDTPQAAHFSFRNRLVASALLGIAGAGHFMWATGRSGWPGSADSVLFAMTLLTLVGSLLCYAALQAVTALAAWLSAIEARYWGMRLPLPIVRRAMQFHSACYVPVGVAGVVVVWGHLALNALRLGWAADAGLYYLLALCGLVIVSAAYLFLMYWIAMKNLMYANR